MNFAEARQQLVNELIHEGIQNPNILNAINTVPRHDFVPKELQYLAYNNSALPIGFEQTISQPYVVAKMTEVLLKDKSYKKILEVGTGSGYQAAILAQLVDEVYSIERIEGLLHRTKKIFEALQYKNIFTLYGDGNLGWPEHAPYDAIVVTAATNSIPINLLEQLKVGGRMIIPIGEPGHQELQLITKREKSYDVRVLDPVIFVPLKSGKI